MMKRLFIALPLDEEARKNLRVVWQTLARFDPVLKRVRPDQYHLTLKFLGDTPEETVRCISESFSSLATIPAIQYSLRGLGAFPQASSPSVIWAGIETGPVLITLVQKVEQFVLGFGFPREKRSFSPHLTLARFKKDRSVPRDLISYITENRETLFGDEIFRTLVLYESVLSKTGPQYTELATLSLNGE